ncbi:hypothetical protein V5O48_014839 [Marasmius crinis-equi]|uniref:Uncharacterized protein n=1 Tax=Marasmius crinis-equi TaxID=585013 RepID=A0ABR3EWI2_9AGAR
MSELLSGSRGKDKYWKSNYYGIDFVRLICRHLEGNVQSLRKLAVSYDWPNLLCDLTASLPWAECGTQLSEEFSSTFGHVVELDLQLESEDSLSLISLMCSFPRLEVLTVRSGLDGSISLGEDMRLPGHFLPASLQTLRLGGAHWDAYYDGAREDGLLLFDRWLHTHCPARLSSLSIYQSYIGVPTAGSPTILPNIEPLLVQCEDDLQFIHIGMDSWRTSTEVVRNVFYNLSTAHRLEGLIISARNIVQRNPPSPEPSSHIMLTVISQMINTVTSPRLQRITFNVSGVGFRVLDKEWGALDTLLASKKICLRCH